MLTVLTTLHSKFIHNSLALPCLAAYCGDGCGNLVIREFTAHEPRESVLACLLAKEPDVIAFSVYIWNRRETLDLVDALGVARPGLRIIVGGPEVSFDDRTLFERHPGITALVRGEGEAPVKALLSAWQAGKEPGRLPRVMLRSGADIIEGPNCSQLSCLDDLPSPFQRGLVDLQRGFVYYETSRGCPFHCSFCLSARDNRMRSYSTNRMRSDLRFLMDNEVPKIKLVDRTFNYDAQRARDIFRFILEHNRTSHFHFEIAAHLLDEATLDLLETVPPGMFQFEIGVQSTLASTLDAVGRKVNLKRLEENVRRLRAADRINLHLDLVAGLPGEGFDAFLASIDRVAALNPNHLQVEPVKLLPGCPLREQAEELQIRFDPNPPYTVLATPELSFEDLQRIQEISRLLDLTWNSGCFSTFLGTLQQVHGGLSAGLVWLAGKLRTKGLFRFPMSRQTLFEEVAAIVGESGDEASRPRLTESLAYDYARSERVVTNRIPAFFDTELTKEEQRWVKGIVTERGEAIRGQGIKLQYFAAAFNKLDETGGRSARLFCYLTGSGRRMQVEEYQHLPQGGSTSLD